VKKESPWTVLIVEDDQTSNENLVEFLQRRFSKVLSAFNGQEGLNLYYDHSPDLIITDIEMPKMNGLKMIKQIRGNDNSTPIIVLSGHSSSEYLVNIIPLGVQGYLYKPFTSAKIDEVLTDITKKIKSFKVRIDTSSDTYYNSYSKMVFIGGDRILLTHLEIILLELLLENRQNIVNYAEIGDALYGSSSFSHNSIKCHIRNLRNKITTANIRAVSKEGYVLL